MITFTSKWAAVRNQVRLTYTHDFSEMYVPVSHFISPS